MPGRPIYFVIAYVVYLLWQMTWFSNIAIAFVFGTVLFVPLLVAVLLLIGLLRLIIPPGLPRINAAIIIVASMGIDFAFHWFVSIYFAKDFFH